MQEFHSLHSQIIQILVDDIDTDQIIPARFLKTTDKLGLGSKLFSDWRYCKDGSDNSEFVLNQPDKQTCQILLAGDNFGCGSSREHAPWALSAWGFRVIISTSFADIFRSNALKNGLLLVQVDKEQHALLAALPPTTEVEVRLAEQELRLAGGEPIPFPMDTFSKRCLLEGLDQLGYLLRFRDDIEKHERESAAANSDRNANS